MMVGFPGETEADFEDTLSLVEAVRYDMMFSFKYSARPGARAESLDGKVPEEEKQRRLERLQALQREITRESNRAYVGKTVEVLVTGPASRSALQVSGRTRTGKLVNFEGPRSLERRLVSVKITRAGQNSLEGVQRFD